MPPIVRLAPPLRKAAPDGLQETGEPCDCVAVNSRAPSASVVDRDPQGNRSGEETDFERRKRLQEETLNAIGAFSAGDRLPREHVHRRGEFR